MAGSGADVRLGAGSASAGQTFPGSRPTGNRAGSAVEGVAGVAGGGRFVRANHGRVPQRSGLPVLHPDLIERAALLEWFSVHRAEPVVAIFAPAGYGKTTLLAQAAEADTRPFAWVSLEDRNNDPVVLVTDVAHGLDRVARVGEDVFEALRFPASALWSSTVPRLQAAFASVAPSVVVVLDDVHLLRNRECLDVVTALCACAAEGSQLVLAGREEPLLGLARVRAERRLAELGRNELAFEAVEADGLLRAAGVDLTGPEVAELTRRTEGWPAGLYLAALSLRQGGSVDREAVSAVASQSRHIGDYLRSEVLSVMAPEQVEFLTRTAVLEWMSGPLCDALLEQTRGAATLEALRRSNRFVVSLDDADERYRYHHLFRALLTHELERREPGIVPTLNRRAAVWCEQNGAPETAIEHAFAGGDIERAARLVTGRVLEVYRSGRLATAQGWIDRLDRAGVLERYPEIAVLGAWAQGLGGHAAQADRLADVAERGSSDRPMVDGCATIEPWVALLRAVMCRHGPEQMRADAKRALELIPGWSPYRSTASLALGVSHLLSGDDGRADDGFADSVEFAKETGSTDAWSVALAERSLLAAARGDVRDAEQFAQAAARVVGDARSEYMTSAITYAALGRAALGRRDPARAREYFGRADRLRPSLGWFFPYMGVQVRFELVRERLACGDQAGARILVREIDQLLRRVPALGVLAEQAGELRREVDAMRTLSGDATPLLTEAELRVLPLLATHLSIAEIADRQYVARGTVKTQATSIYRKLDVTSRSEAVERAAQIGLIDSTAVPPRRDFHLSG
jgi:LuxR family transcriptional regulator, maltose regulon positive regulatory protein